jgi:hypothetical protein
MALTRHSGFGPKCRATCLTGAVLLFAVGCAPAGKPLPAGPASAVQALTPAQLLGIEVVAIRWSAQGMMLDFRYRVVDAVKAQPLMDRSIKPYLIEEVSGARFGIPGSPTVGPMRQTALRAEVGRVYWMFFGNPGRQVKPGNRVTVVVGEIRLEHLTVQ